MISDERSEERMFDRRPTAARGAASLTSDERSEERMFDRRPTAARGAASLTAKP
jgi:hypothetical protein